MTDESSVKSQLCAKCGFSMEDEGWLKCPRCYHRLAASPVVQSEPKWVMEPPYDLSKLPPASVQYRCEFFDCDFVGRFAVPPENCPECGRKEWRELQTPPVVQSRESTLPELDEVERFHIFHAIKRYGRIQYEHALVDAEDYDRCLSALTAARAQVEQLEKQRRLEGNADLHRQSRIGNLEMLVRRMARRLSKHKEHVDDAKLAEQAMQFIGPGSVLRTAPTASLKQNEETGA